MPQGCQLSMLFPLVVCCLHPSIYFLIAPFLGIWQRCETRVPELVRQSSSSTPRTSYEQTTVLSLGLPSTIVQIDGNFHGATYPYRRDYGGTELAEEFESVFEVIAERIAGPSCWLPMCEHKGVEVSSGNPLEPCRALGNLG